MSVISRASTAIRQQMVRRGSTRSAGLLRIGLSALAMARWGQNLTVDQIMQPTWLVVFGLVMLAALFSMLIGFKSRISSGIVAICALATGFGLNSWAGWQPANFSHHEACLAVCLAMLALQPNGGSYSVDRWLAVRRAEAKGDPIPPEEGELWAWPLMGVALSCVYFYGAIIKCHWGYFNGDRLEQVMMYKFLGSELPRNMVFQGTMVVSAVGSVVLEFALAIGMWFRRYRWHLVFAGTAFHLLIYATMTVYTFSLTMVFMYLAYFPVDAVHRELDRIHGSAPRPQT